MMSTLINKWFSTVKRTLFKHENGFFELPIMSNSPETIIQGVAKMPFVKHLPDKEYFGSNNPFMKADVHYHEIEKGLWSICSNINYYENVNYIQHKYKYIKSDYYLLFLEFTQSKIVLKNGLIDGIPYAKTSWGLIKPDSPSTYCHFKGNNATSLSLYMNQEWVDKVLVKNKGFLSGSLNSFFESNAKLMMFSENIQVFKTLETESKEAFDTNSWGDFTTHFITHFIQKYNSQNRNKNLFDISEINRSKIINAEQYLCNSINTDFMGVEELSILVGLSATQLKINFKIVYGDSIFQYFRKKKLESAKIIFENNDLTVKQVASLFDYSNASKFTVAYKDHFGVLPSEVNKKSPLK